MQNNMVPDVGGSETGGTVCNVSFCHLREAEHQLRQQDAMKTTKYPPKNTVCLNLEQDLITRNMSTFATKN